MTEHSASAALGVRGICKIVSHPAHRGGLRGGIISRRDRLRPVNEAALDGVQFAAGVLVGAAATIGGVVLANRHDRKMRNSDLLDSALVHLYACAQEMTWQLIGHRGKGRLGWPVGDYYRNLLDAFIPALARSRRNEHELYTLLQQLMKPITPAILVKDYAVLTALVGAIAQWLADPKPIRRGKITADGLVESLQQRKSTVSDQTGSNQDGTAQGSAQ